jgi:peptide methionine sulfoxide reductase MsrB
MTCPKCFQMMRAREDGFYHCTCCETKIIILREAFYEKYISKIDKYEDKSLMRLRTTKIRIK